MRILRSFALLPCTAFVVLCLREVVIVPHRAVHPATLALVPVPRHRRRRVEAASELA